MNVIEKVKDILKNYEHISEFVNDIHIDFTDSDAKSYGLSSIGDALLSKDILDNETRQHNFILYARAEAYEDFDRLQNSNFLLELNYWLEKQKDIEINNGKITSLSSANGMLYEIPDGDLNNGVLYQLQIYAEYTREVIENE